MSPRTPPPDLAILVLGHSRPWALRCVLEGLRREGVLAQTEVWLDGHGAKRGVQERVLATQAVAAEFPVARIVAYEAAVGHDRRMFEALADVQERAPRILAIEDDCFPAPGSIRALSEALDEIADDPAYFSVYGDPFGVEGEADGTWLFRPFGWATTREKLAPVLAELRTRYMAPELAHRQWMQELIEAHPPDQPFLADGQMREADYMGHFQWDAVLPLLLARAGQKNRVTPTRVLWNFGIGYDSWHLVGGSSIYSKPPFNMLTPQELCERFELQIPELEQRLRIEPHRTYRLVAQSEDARLLELGWGGSEPWGTWAVEPAAQIRVELPATRKPKGGVFEFLVRAEPAAGSTPVEVTLIAGGQRIAHWTFRHARSGIPCRARLPRAVHAASGPLTLEFQVSGARSPHERGVSTDTRRIGFGLSELRFRPR